MPKGAKDREEGPRDAPATRGPLTVIILSGGSGRTGEAVVAAALAQFPEPSVRIVSKAGVRAAAAARRIVQEAADEGAVVVHTLVAPKIREAVKREAERRSVPLVDLLGPVINALSDHLRAEPQNKPGLLYEQRKESFDRIDAVDFTLTHDDGAGLADLDQADVVLVGASRVSKSVTCFYLAYRGIRAANVPLIARQEPPPELARLDPKKVIALVMNAQRLRALRSARWTDLGSGSLERYLDRDAVTEELRHIHDLIARHRWRSIDVSYMAVEEVASEVIKAAGLL